MKNVWIIFAIFLMAGITACEKNESTFEDPENGGVLLLELRKSDDAGSNSGIVLYAETTNHFGCLGYSIRTDYSQRNGLAITYGDIIAPDGYCAAALGPATSLVSLENLEVGTHTVTIDYLGQTVAGTLEVTAVSYKISLEENDIIRVVVGEVERA